MITIRKYEPEDMLNIELQKAQEADRSMITEETCKQYVSDLSFTAIDEENKILFIGGLIRIWEGRYFGWSLISKHSNNRFISITRGVTNLLNQFLNCRVECYVDPYFKEAKRWAEILGFKEEGYMHQFYENKNDALLYAKV